MKIILKDTNDIKNVSFGYAVNYLLPQGLAELATPEKIKALEKKQKELIKNQQQKQKTDKGLVKKLAGKTFVIKAKVGKAKKLYAGITKKNILKSLGVDPDKIEVILTQPIKKLGKHRVELKIGSQRLDILVEVKKKDEA